MKSIFLTLFTVYSLLGNPFKKGREAAMLYIPTGTVTKNPYKEGSKKWHEWQRGWHSEYEGVRIIETKTIK